MLRFWEYYQLFGAFLCMLSCTCSFWLWAKVALVAERRRLIHRQIAHLAMATCLSEVAHAALWLGGSFDWRSMADGTRYTYCDVAERIWMFCSFWSCCSTAHIVAGIFLASRHNLSHVRRFSKTLIGVPLISLLLIIPALFTEVRFVQEYDELACMMSNVTDGFLCSTILVCFLIVTCASARLLCVVRTSAPQSVWRRVSSDALIFITVYLSTWLGVMICHICRLTGDHSAFLEWTLIPLSDLLASLRGTLEAAVYMRLIRRDRRRSCGADGRSAASNSVAKCDVAFRPGPPSLTDITPTASVFESVHSRLPRIEDHDDDNEVITQQLTLATGYPGRASRPFDGCDGQEAFVAAAHLSA